MKIYEVVLEEKGEYNGPTDASDSDKVIEILRNYGLHKRAEECMVLLTLNSDLEVTGIFEVARGNVDEIVIELREIMKRACLMNATEIILAHNHVAPSDAAPSDEDIELTKKISVCGRMLGIHLIDHIVVSMEDAVSIKEIIG